MQILNDMNQCYGCGACENACPVGAITLRYNDEGFLHANVDDDKCVNCMKCKNVCIVHKKVEDKNSDAPRSYAFAQSMDQMQESASGGFFPILAQKVLGENGVVFGTVYNEKFEAIQVGAERIEDIAPMKMSKYIQSNTGTCYKEARKVLEEGRPVLYVGCPCQVAGLNSYLGKKYDNLYTVDLICFGVPSSRLFSEHLEHTYGTDNIEHVEMRKRKGWGSCLNVYLKNGEKVSFGGKKEIFMLSFKSKMMLKRTCYGCKFATVPRQGDFTLGDFWNKKKLNIQLGEEFNKKCSIIFINSDNGEKLFKKVYDDRSEEMYFHELTDLGYTAAELNNNIGSAACEASEDRERFFDLYFKQGFENAAYKVLFPKFKDRMYARAQNNLLLKKIKKLIKK